MANHPSGPSQKGTAGRSKRSFVCCLFAALVAVSVVEAVGTSKEPGDLAAALEQYARGDYAAASTFLYKVTDFEGLRKGLRQLEPRWVDAAGVDKRHRREIVISAFALEAARAGLDEHWTSARDLVETACEWVRRSGTPTPAERYWFLGSIALAERARDARLLTDVNTGVQTTGPTGLPLPVTGNIQQPYGFKNFNHLGHARSRFPEEPRLLVAQAFVAEPALEDVPPRDAVWLSDDALATGSSKSGIMAAQLDGRRRLSVAATIYGRIAAIDGITGEVHLRLGSVLQRLHQFPPAQEHLRKTEDLTSEPFLLYLAHFFTGQILAETGNPAGASEEYQRALEAVPDAQSGVTALAAALFLDGKRDEAFRIASRGIENPVADPWRMYSYGDFRLWPQFIAQLRAELK